MELLEKNHEFISDATYQSFIDFMKNIVPEYLEAGLEKRIKTIYIPISNKEDGVYIGAYNLGKIYYVEFISYIFGLLSFIGLKTILPSKVMDNFLMPFNLKELINDYYRFLQMEDYLNYKENFDNNSLMGLTELAIESFKTNILESIITDAFQGKYRVEDIIDTDGVTVLKKTLYLPLEIKNEDLMVGEYNLGKVNVKAVLKYLTSLPGFYHENFDKSNLDSDYLLVYDFKSLIDYYFSQTRGR